MDDLQAYTGIGSRSTPNKILRQMEQIAVRMREIGWMLRSGHAPGADQAFERGAFGQAQIFKPWASFEHEVPVLGAPFHTPTHEAYVIAAEFHPRWKFLTRGAKMLHARNSHQILGPFLNDPVKFVVCWTPDGKASGGTGQAMRIAESEGIPIYNLFDLERTREFQEEWLNV